jgi:hypothetical protein
MTAAATAAAALMLLYSLDETSLPTTFQLIYLLLLLVWQLHVPLRLQVYH